MTDSRKTCFIINKFNKYNNYILNTIKPTETVLQILISLFDNNYRWVVVNTTLPDRARYRSSYSVIGIRYSIPIRDPSPINYVSQAKYVFYEIPQL